RHPAGGVLCGPPSRRTAFWKSGRDGSLTARQRTVQDWATSWWWIAGRVHAYLPELLRQYPNQGTAFQQPGRESDRARGPACARFSPAWICVGGQPTPRSSSAGACAENASACALSKCPLRLAIGRAVQRSE